MECQQQTFLLIIKQENLVSHHVEWGFFLNTKSNQTKKIMAIKHREHIHTLLLQLWNICNFPRTKHENVRIQLPLSLNIFNFFICFSIHDENIIQEYISFI